jgi:hypothetical protein
MDTVLIQCYFNNGFRSKHLSYVVLEQLSVIKCHQVIRLNSMC